jgi:hypothetical protein
MNEDLTYLEYFWEPLTGDGVRYRNKKWVIRGETEIPEQLWLSPLRPTENNRGRVMAWTQDIEWVPTAPVLDRICAYFEIRRVKGGFRLGRTFFKEPTGPADYVAMIRAARFTIPKGERGIPWAP